MAWRIDESVVRGQLDNRARGRVTGRIWLVGHAEPVALELTGNCWRDLAGRRLEFINPQPKPADLDKFALLQRGVVGDITASRKVRVPDIPLDQLHLYYKTGREMPWHWGNSLYLEWFSECNGRVVIETTTFDLKIIGEPAWEMSKAQEEEQRRANAAAMTAFIDRLDGAAESLKNKITDDTPPEWGERPQTEAEAEAQQARSDRLADRIQARLQREGESADYEKILEEELDRLDREEGRPEPTPEQLARNAEWIDEVNRAGEETLANPDPEMEAELAYEHPLVKQTADLFDQVHATAKQQGWVPEGAGQEHPVVELRDAIMMAGAKLAGALNGHYWPPEIDFCAHTIVRLKKARDYLDDALRAAESCREEKMIVPEHLGPIVVELIDLVDDTEALIAELRAKLERGTD